MLPNPSSSLFWWFRLENICLCMFGVASWWFSIWREGRMESIIQRGELSHYFLFNIFLFVCVFVCTCVCISACMWMLRPNVDTRHGPQSHSTLFIYFEIAFLTEPEAHQDYQIIWRVHPMGFLIFVSPVLELQVYALLGIIILRCVAFTCASFV